MTRTRKLTLSVKEFSHLVSESLDIVNATPASQSLQHTAVFSEIPQKSHPRASSFQRIFSRPTPGQLDDSPERTPEDRSETTRKMIAWPFSRSPRKNRPAGDEDNATVRTIPLLRFCLFVHLTLAGQGPRYLSHCVAVLSYVSRCNVNVESWFHNPYP